MLAFSPEAFYALFAAYNQDIWPAQIAAYALGLLALAGALRPFAGSDRVIAAVLTLFWAWNGAVYHWGYFAGINFVAPAFAALFLAQAVLLAWTGVLRGRVAFRFSRSLAGWAGIGLALYGLALYPATNWLAGHVWPALPMFGVAPCPTTIFTLGLLLLAGPRVPWHLMGLPLVWAAIGATAAWLLGVPEDLALGVAGVLALVLAVATNRQRRREHGGPASPPHAGM